MKSWFNSDTLLWAILATSVIGTTIGVIKFIKGTNVLPTVTPIMENTHFKQPEQIGAVLYRRFWVEASKHKLIVLGGIDTTSERVWKGFREVATREFNVRFDDSAHRLLIVPSSSDELKIIQKSFPNALIFFESSLPVTQDELTEAKYDCKNSQLACYAFAAAGQKNWEPFHSHRKKVKQWTAAIMQLKRLPNTSLVFVHNPAQ